jgi:serine acetyltransferase
MVALQVPVLEDEDGETFVTLETALCWESAHRMWAYRSTSALSLRRRKWYAVAGSASGITESGTSARLGPTKRAGTKLLA